MMKLSRTMKVLVTGVILILASVVASLFIGKSQAMSVLAVTTSPGASDWWTLGANLQRTSWVTEEVRGNLNVEWYRPIEPYIPYKVQPIAANGMIYISTAKGLYAFSAIDGSQVWVYPTELPLGHSPTFTIINNNPT